MERLVVMVTVNLLASQLQLESAAAVAGFISQVSVRGYGNYNSLGSVFNSGCVPSGGNMICLSLAAIDGDIGPSAISVNLDDRDEISHFTIWQKDTSSTEQYIKIEFKETPLITFDRIRLYFLNYPSENIGLPNLQLTYNAIPTSYTLTADDVLSSMDEQVRSVTLNASSTATSALTVTLKFSFDGLNNIDWLFLSEVTFCEPVTFTFLEPSTATVMPSPISLGRITLNCSVEGSATYDWRWMKGQLVITEDSEQYLIQSGARQTELSITRLLYSDEGQYACEIRQSTQAVFCDSKSIQLELPAVVSTTAIVRAASADRSVLLYCELHGYLRDASGPKWYLAGSSTPIMNGTKYSIATADGTLPTVSSGGMLVPSKIVVLTIKALEEADAGLYQCQYSTAGVLSSTTLSVNGTSDPNITKPDPNVAKPAVKDCFGAGPIVAVIAAAVVVTAIVVTITNTLVFWLIWKKQLKEQHDVALSETLYEEVDPPVRAATSIATPTPYSVPLTTSGVEVELQENQCYGPLASQQVEMQKSS